MSRLVVGIVGGFLVAGLLLPSPAITQSVPVEQRVEWLEDEVQQNGEYIVTLFAENDRLRGALQDERVRRRHQLYHLRRVIRNQRG